jgi:hypothetical protein
MQFLTDFKPLSLDDIYSNAESRHAEGWRYVQILAVNKEDAVDMIYSFMKDGVLDNFLVSDVARDATVRSITDFYLEAFVCENEIHDLFGVNIEGIAIDFQGNFYHLSTDTPMTVISAAQLAEREKAKKIAAAKAAKAAKEAKAAGGSENATPASDQEDLEAKLAGMDPEKAAKVRAAMEAKAKRAKAKEASNE